MIWSIDIILRAVAFTGITSLAKSKFSSALGSDPEYAWQNWQRTPRACVKFFIIGTMSASFVSFGRTRRFEGGLKGDCWVAVPLNAAQPSTIAIATQFGRIPFPPPERFPLIVPDSGLRPQNYSFVATDNPVGGDAN